MTTVDGALAALKDKLNDSTITSPYDATLTMYEFPLDAEQGANALPYGFIVPPAQRDIPEANGGLTVELGAVTVRILIAGPSGRPEQMAQERAAWITALRAKLSDSVKLEGAADIVREWSWSELLSFEPGGLWGFDLTLDIKVSEIATRSA